MLMRGRSATTYQFRYNGTYYWHTPEYKLGDLVYNGKQYHNILLNIDACKQDLLFKDSTSVAEILLKKELVEEFSIDGKPFVNTLWLGEDAPKGYCEVLYDGKAKILKQVLKNLESDSTGKNNYVIGDYNANTAANVFDFFALNIRYYYMDPSGKITRIKNKSALLKQFKSRKSDIRRYLASVKNSNDLPLEEYFSLVMNYVEK